MSGDVHDVVEALSEISMVFEVLRQHGELFTHSFSERQKVLAVVKTLGRIWAASGEDIGS